MNINGMNGVETARVHIENARDILSKKGNKKEGYYQNPKYVKMAGHTAYTGVLAALDELIQGKLKIRPKKGDRENVLFYRDNIGKINKKKLNDFNHVYNVLHRSMGYDGEGKATLVSEALDTGENIIDWVDSSL